VSGVLYIAWSYFWFLPMQRWMNLVGTAFLAVGLLLFLRNGMDLPALRDGAFACVIGGFIIALVPGYSGGAALRLASTRCQMQLRPHGRARMLLGATLAITLVALLVVAPMLLMQLTGPAHGSGTNDSTFYNIAPLTMFATAWSIIALLWCGMFFATGSMLLFFLIVIVPPAVIRLVPLLLDSTTGTVALFVACPCVWLAFALWYFNVHLVATPIIGVNSARAGDPTEASFGAGDSPLYRLASAVAAWVDRLTAANSRVPEAGLSRRVYLLGTFTLLGRFVAGAVPTLLLLLVWYFLPASDSMRQIPTMWLLMASMVPGFLGQAMARRARFIWLRAGLGRADLFRLAERTGLPAAAVMLTAITIAFLAVSLSSRPDRAAVILLFVAEQAALATCVFYAGLCATRGWDITGVLLTAAGFVTVLFQAIVIQPHHYTGAKVIAVTLLLLLLGAVLLRRLALRRWLALDWRVARLPPLNQRTGF
jgi:hypothetical protein